MLVGGPDRVRRQGGLVPTFEAINQRESRDISRTEWLAFADAVFGAAAAQFDEPAAAAAGDDDADSYEDAGEVDGFVAALSCVGACERFGNRVPRGVLPTDRWRSTLSPRPTRRQSLYPMTRTTVAEPRRLAQAQLPDSHMPLSLSSLVMRRLQGPSGGRSPQNRHRDALHHCRQLCSVAVPTQQTRVGHQASAATPGAATCSIAPSRGQAGSGRVGRCTRSCLTLWTATKGGRGSPRPLQGLAML